MEEGNAKEGQIKLKKVTLWQLISAVLTIALLLSIFTGGFGIGATESGGATGNAVYKLGQGAAAAPAPAQQQAQPAAGGCGVF